MVVPQIISQLPGKSLVSRHVTRRAVNASVEDIKIGHTYLDCSKSSTEVQVISTIGQQLNDEDIYHEDEDVVKMPDTGLPKDKFYKRLWQILDHYDSAIIILDEVDLLKSDRVLMSLAKAVESNDTWCQIGIIAISNQINFFDESGAHVRAICLYTLSPSPNDLRITMVSTKNQSTRPPFSISKWEMKSG